jgi:FeS assembly SUF system protein
MPYSHNPMKLDLDPGDEDQEATPAPATGPVASEDRGAASSETPGAPRQEGPGLEDRVIRALKTVYDPEIPVDIYELGLVYDLAVDETAGTVHVKMTLTSPACPVAGSLPGEVQQRVESVAGVDRAEVEIVWDPAWNPGMMSEVAKLELGFF